MKSQFQNAKEYDAYKYVIVPHHGDWLSRSICTPCGNKTEKQHLKYTIFLEFQWSDEK